MPPTKADEEIKHLLGFREASFPFLKSRSILGVQSRVFKKKNLTSLTESSAHPDVASVVEALQAISLHCPP